MPVTWGKVLFFALNIGFRNQFLLLSHPLTQYGRKNDEKVMPIIPLIQQELYYVLFRTTQVHFNAIDTERRRLLVPECILWESVFSVHSL